MKKKYQKAQKVTFIVIHNNLGLLTLGWQQGFHNHTFGMLPSFITNLHVELSLMHQCQQGIHCLATCTVATCLAILILNHGITWLPVFSPSIL